MRTLAFAGLVIAGAAAVAVADDRPAVPQTQPAEPRGESRLVPRGDGSFDIRVIPPTTQPAPRLPRDGRDRRDGRFQFRLRPPAPLPPSPRGRDRFFERSFGHDPMPGWRPPPGSVPWDYDGVRYWVVPLTGTGTRARPVPPPPPPPSRFESDSKR